MFEGAKAIFCDIDELDCFVGLCDRCLFSTKARFLINEYVRVTGA